MPLAASRKPQNELFLPPSAFRHCHHRWVPPGRSAEFIRLSACWVHTGSAWIIGWSKPNKFGAPVAVPRCSLCPPRAAPASIDDLRFTPRRCGIRGSRFEVQGSTFLCSTPPPVGAAIRPVGAANPPGTAAPTPGGTPPTPVAPAPTLSRRLRPRLPPPRRESPPRRLLSPRPIPPE